jgi:hypothetical protein
MRSTSSPRQPDAPPFGIGLVEVAQTAVDVLVYCPSLDTQLPSDVCERDVWPKRAMTWRGN